MVGGNKTIQIQTKAVSVNAIGEQVKSWATQLSLTGFLDYTGGDSKYTTYDAKMQESTHIFICDYQDLGSISADNSRVLINSKVYDIMLIDNPMGLNKHLEIYLKFVGGQ